MKLPSVRRGLLNYPNQDTLSPRGYPKYPLMGVPRGYPKYPLTGVPRGYPKNPLTGMSRGHVSHVIPAPATSTVNINITRVKILTSESEVGA